MNTGAKFFGWYWVRNGLAPPGRGGGGGGGGGGGLLGGNSEVQRAELLGNSGVMQVKEIRIIFWAVHVQTTVKPLFCSFRKLVLVEHLPRQAHHQDKQQQLHLK